MWAWLTKELITIDSVKLKKFWNKWGVLLFVLLAVYSAYKTFTPKEVKIIKTEKVVTNKVEETRLKEQISKLQKKIKNYSREIREDEIIVETTYPDGRIEKRIEKKRVTSESGSSTESASSSGTTTSDTHSTEHTVKDTTETKTVNPNPFWSTEVAYLFGQRQAILGQGINLGRGFTGMVLGSYRFDESITPENRADIGCAIILRY